MKKITMFLVAHFFVLLVVVQEELHIHNINVENGDATMIGIYDTETKKYTAKILIDGGMSSADKILLPYLKKMVGPDKESLHFNYVILTHYHNDHYIGLLALKTGKITADSIIDPGGYPVDSIFPSGSHSVTRPPNLKRAIQWLTMLKVASHHSPEPYIKARSEAFLNFGTTSKTAIGKSFILGRIGSNDVKITCVAGWGNTLSDDGIESNPDPDLENANNYTLAFIISCGEFRYFIGGDMGGRHSSAYIDQETTVTKYLNSKYPEAISSDENT